MIEVLRERRAGVLLHPTSLPGPGGAGTLGRNAFEFVDFLATAGFTVWQTLPLGPVDRFGSPYRLRSVHAGNPRLIDAAAAREMAKLPEKLEIGTGAIGELTETYRAFDRLATPVQRGGFADFVRKHRRWLVPYALFELYRSRFGQAPWWSWPVELREHSPDAFRHSLADDSEQLHALAFQQYLFESQWKALKRHANSRGVYLFGDMPLYVDLDSVEVWWHRSLFRLDREGRPEAVAGVPPDYFSADGQLWGNPLYEWERMRADGFRWWVRRVRHEMERFDLVRIDHFRALESYWEIPAGAATAVEGKWRAAPGEQLLETLRAKLGGTPLVAEDLGSITPEVYALRDRFDLPGMLVLQFAFDGASDNPYLPRNHRRNAVVYTGTHDNDTLVGWYRSLSDSAKTRVAELLRVSVDALPGVVIEAAYASEARLAILPMQDLLGLGSEARMNTPGTTEGNWRWRFRREDLSEALARHYGGLAERFARVPRP
jgi:4-alpha-glucanotransferase